MKYLVITVAAVLLLVTGSLIIAGFRWKDKSRKLLEGLERAAEVPESGFYRPQMLEGLPEPVQRYFRTVLEPGVLLLTGARVLHRGTFNMAEEGSNWKAFSSEQRVSVYPPGFLWDARISILPGLDARVHDGYIDGEGLLKASLGGLIPLVELEGPGEIARGELMRWLAEAAWYPTALLPGRNLHWEAVDGTSARAVLQDGGIGLSLLFRFTDEGLIDSVWSDGRERMVAGGTERTPWEGRWSNYQWREGMLIPLSGEVLWRLSGGEKPYWRGEITEIEYEYADTGSAP
ncbi:DUF6920 family protein [Marispirochaeta aestuarii]|uniref:DUF6920 family protein n=1 Tax=Marispirochaeta aestuarii TaxID=1963862 RepID=UPI0029C977A3|nr:DUF6544 family protein [Marispirochaeta aestuarii]